MPPALEAKAGDAEVTRGPEWVDKVWDENVDGAWAPGKASVSLLTTFLKCVQERDSVEAERAARESKGLKLRGCILEVEPNNRLVRDLLDAMKQHDAMEAAADAEEGSSEEGSSEEEGGDDDEEEEDSSEEDEDQSDDDDSNEAKEQGAEEKNNDGE